jgi:hypothetical protein
VYVDDKPYGQGDLETLQGLNAGTLSWTGEGMYFVETFEGSRKLTLYPTPSESDLSIVLRVTKTPTVLAADADEPDVPEDFRSAIRDYAYAQTLGLVEDNPEVSEFFMGRFHEAVDELYGLRNFRYGDGPVTMQIQGIHY